MDIVMSESKYENIRIRGVMGMASYTDDVDVVRGDFKKLADVFAQFAEKIGKYPNLDESCTEISMGMSGDYPIAIEEGSTMVRIGSMIFGERYV